MMIDNSEIEECLEKAIARAGDDDRYLLEKGLHESAITHRIAMYLEEEFFTKYPELKLVADVEFNRDVSPDGSDIRTGCDGRMNTTDLVVHVRDTHQHNLLAIEAKKKRKGNEAEFEEARERLRYLVANGERRFQLGALLTYFFFGKDSDVALEDVHITCELVA